MNLKNLMRADNIDSVQSFNKDSYYEDYIAKKADNVFVYFCTSSKCCTKIVNMRVVKDVSSVFREDDQVVNGNCKMCGSAAFRKKMRKETLLKYKSNNKMDICD